MGKTSDLCPIRQYKLLPELKDIYIFKVFDTFADLTSRESSRGDDNIKGKAGEEPTIPTSGDSDKSNGNDQRQARRQSSLPLRPISQEPQSVPQVRKEEHVSGHWDKN